MNEIKSLCLKFEPVGSRVTCNPPPLDTDIDYLLLVTPEEFNDFEIILFDSGYDMGGSKIHAGGCLLGDENSFQSYTKGEVNLIVTASDEFFYQIHGGHGQSERVESSSQRGANRFIPRNPLRSGPMTCSQKCAQGDFCTCAPHIQLDEPLTTAEALIFYAIVLLCIAALAVIAGASLPYLP